MRSRPLPLVNLKGRAHAPSKPAARGGKAAPVRPKKRTGHFGFVVPGLERLARRADMKLDLARIRADREADRARRAG